MIYWIFYDILLNFYLNLYSFSAGISYSHLKLFLTTDILLPCCVCLTPLSPSPRCLAVGPSRAVLVVKHSGIQQVLPECGDCSGDSLPGVVTVADVI